MADDQHEQKAAQYRAWVAGLPEAMRHHYTHVAANQPIGLYQGPLRVSVQGTAQEFEAVGGVALQWLPTPRIVYHAELAVDNMTSFGMMGSDLAVRLPDTIDHDVPAQLDAISPEREPSQQTMIIGGHERILTIGGSHEVARVRFGLVNFMELFGSWVRGEDRVFHGRVGLLGDGWLIALDQQQRHDELLKQLKSGGGYAFTHIGELRRVDGATFLPGDAKPILEALHYFFSFAQGAFAGLMLPVGYNHNDEPIWTEWSCPTTDPWEPAMAWCDTTRPDQLVDLFPLFLDRWRDPYWEGVIRLAVQYYRDANEPQPVQGAIAMAQVVLELLAYAVLVEDGKHLSKSAYNQHHADENLAMLLDHLGIPTDLPANLSALCATAHAEGWRTGPRAITALRNAVIHPKRNSRRFDNQTWIDAWQLIVWYVELSMLSFFGYKGVYRNRLRRERWGGLVEDVPWAGASVPTP